MSKKILLINDMPGYGKVAISAMTPILVRKGFEVFNLPTMIVSNTLNYGKFASIDTTEYMKEAMATWKELGFKFDAVATGFIASDKQADYICELCKEQSDCGAMILTDPIMADNGKLYNSITSRRIDSMRNIISVADCIFPNLTECCFLSGTEYREAGFEEEELYAMALKLNQIGAKSVLITSADVKTKGGESYKAVVGYDSANKHFFTVKYDEKPYRINGTGDTFSALVTAELLEGAQLEAAAVKGVKAVGDLIENSVDIISEYNGLPIEKYIEKL